MKINHDTIRKSSMLKSIKRFSQERSPLGYIVNRMQWHMNPRVSRLHEYPLHIDIEPTSHCQLECPMCFRAHRKIENEGIMSLDMFKRIIDEIEGKIYSIKFTGRGEPLINKKFPEFMEYLKDKKFGEIALITNGQLMNDRVMNAIIDYGMDRVAFSIDGLKEEYEKIRAPIKYEQIYGIVKKLYDLRNSKGKTKPIIRIQPVASCVTDEQEFLKIWEPISDHIQFLVFKDYSADARGKKQAGYACPFLYQRMVVHWNGTVPMCINDEYEEGVMGDFNKQSIKEIWHGTRFKGARIVHHKGLRDKIYKNCSKCALHREGHGKVTLGYLMSGILRKNA